MPKQALQPGKPGKQKTSALALPELLSGIYLVLMASFFLLYFNDKGYGDIAAAKRNLFYSLTFSYLGLLVLAVIASVINQKTGAEARAELKQRIRGAGIVPWAMLVYVLMSLISSLLSPHGNVVWLGYSRFEGFVSILLYVLMFAGLMLFARPKQWMTYVLGACVVVMAVIGILQVCGGNPLGLYQTGRSYALSDGKFLTPIGNVDSVAIVLCVFLPIFLVTILRGKGKERFVLLLPVLASLYLLLQIFVLGGFFGLTVGCAIALPMALRFSDKGCRRYYIALGALVAGSLVVLYLVDIGDGMFHEMHEILHGNFDDRFGSGRIFIWRQALERIRLRPWFGYGPDTMRLEDFEPFRRYDEELQREVIGRINAAHNDYINILFHQGVFALAAYLTGLVGAVVHYFRHARADAVAAICGTGALCYMAAAFFGISQPINTPFFWIALALLEGAVLTRRHTSDELPSNQSKPERR